MTEKTITTMSDLCIETLAVPIAGIMVLGSLFITSMSRELLNWYEVCNATEILLLICGVVILFFKPATQFTKKERRVALRKAAYVAVVATVIPVVMYTSGYIDHALLKKPIHAIIFLTSGIGLILSFAIVGYFGIQSVEESLEPRKPR